jgi:hypothetical protein
VAHTCNPSYSEGRDLEDRGLKPAWTNSSQEPISKNPSQKRAGGMVQGVGYEFKLQHCKNKQKTTQKYSSKSWKTIPTFFEVEIAFIKFA